MSNEVQNPASCQTAVSGSALIAEFMADKKELPHYLFCFLKSEYKTGWYEVERMQFHTSWDWFMPVYRKIRDIINDRSKYDKNTITTLDLLELDVQISVTEVNLKKAFDYAVKFVAYWNACQADR